MGVWHAVCLRNRRKSLLRKELRSAGPGSSTIVVNPNQCELSIRTTGRVALGDPHANGGLQESVGIMPKIESACTVAYGILKRTPLNRGMVQCDRGIATTINTLAIRPVRTFPVVRFDDHRVNLVLVVSVSHYVSLVCVCVCVCVCWLSAPHLNHQ